MQVGVFVPINNNGWLILSTHDVSEKPSPYGSTPGMLDWALGRVAHAVRPRSWRGSSSGAGSGQRCGQAVAGAECGWSERHR